MALTKVKTGQIGTDVIVAEDIAANAITVSELQDNAVTAAKLYVTGNGTSGQALTSDGDGTFSWTTITSDLVGDTTPQLGGDLASNGNDINFADNDKAQFGSSNDLQIYHNGSHSYIADSGAGNLTVLAGNLYINNAADSETMLSAVNDGAVTLYYDNAAKLATKSNGVIITGEMASDSISLNDNAKANFGNSSDLQIWHNGSNSYIDEVGTGNLRIRAADLEIMKAGTAEYMIRGVADGAVTLYYDNSQKLITTTTGVSITGDLSVSGSLGTGKVLQTITTTGASEYSFSSGAWRDLTSFNATITPISTSSKIFILVTMNGGSSSNNFYGHGRVLRGTTPIGIGNSAGNAQLQIGFSIAMENGYSKQQTFSYSYMDSPSTTSATTYKVQVYPYNANFTWNRVGEVSSETGYGRSISTRTLFEIGG